MQNKRRNWPKIPLQAPATFWLASWTSQRLFEPLHQSLPRIRTPSFHKTTLSPHRSPSCRSTKLLVHPSILKVFACSSAWIYLCIRSCQTKVTKLLIISNMLRSRSSKRQGLGLARLPLSRMLLHAGRCLRTSSKVCCCCLIVPDSYFFSPISVAMLFPQLLFFIITQSENV